MTCPVCNGDVFVDSFFWKGHVQWFLRCADCGCMSKDTTTTPAGAALLTVDEGVRS